MVSLSRRRRSEKAAAKDVPAGRPTEDVVAVTVIGRIRRRRKRNRAGEAALVLKGLPGPRHRVVERIIKRLRSRSRHPVEVDVVLGDAGAEWGSCSAI